MDDKIDKHWPPVLGHLAVRVRTVALLFGLLVSLPVCAWGDLGHQVTALIAYRHLTPQARAALEQMLAADHDNLTAPDFASRSTWADRHRNLHRDTAAWHYIDVEIDHPDPNAACFGFPALAPGTHAAQGAANDCVVNKIEEFYRELKDKSMPLEERQLALKFLIHFVGDLHQPLHAADDHDRGGNCVTLSPSPDGEVANLHAYWDVTVVAALGKSAAQIAARLDPASDEAASRGVVGNVHDWAQESFELATRDVYRISSRPTCQNPGAVDLTPGYKTQAETDAALQLRRAGLRIAALLNQALAP
ncbi:MAG TPA: S1/P1 nuclease [Steroidobacteraceae bacterium]